MKEAENEEKCMIKLQIVKMMKMKLLVIILNNYLLPTIILILILIRMNLIPIMIIVISNLLTQIKIVIILLMMILMKAKHLMIKNYKNISKMLVLQVYKE